MRVKRIEVPLSKLRSSKTNPRRGRPAAEAHQKMVASIRAFGLLEPLIVRPLEDGEYQVVAGNRRLSALRQVHRSDDPAVRCEVRDVDDATAEALALSENFVREDMHPLDEAESFARLASDEAQGPAGIAAMFGVNERYVRQRMKLAGLARVVKTALRGGEIDLATAEVFASVPEDRQAAIWQELNGQPRHADQVRSVIRHEWIDARNALFDLATLDAHQISQDLFAECVLVEREAFMAAQGKALEAERQSLLDDGWRDVVVGSYEDVNPSYRGMEAAERSFDPETEKQMARLVSRRQAWESKYEALSEDDEKAAARIESKLEAIDTEAQAIEQAAPVFYADAVKAVATAFVMLLPDGQVRREFRVPRTKAGSSVEIDSADGSGQGSSSPRIPTSDDLSERQLSDLFVHQTLAVREALLKSASVRKRLLALILHNIVRSEALAVRHEPNAVTLHAERTEGFVSEPFQWVKEKRQAIDPFMDQPFVSDVTAYDTFCGMSDSQLNQLIEVLIVETLTAQLRQPTELVQRLAVDLKVNLRKTWRPDALWLAGFQKIQLTHLLATLKGPVYSPAHETRKKSELVNALATLFADADGNKIDDQSIALRVNGWLPPVCRPCEATAAVSASDRD